jgi:beta-lactamase class A
MRALLFLFPIALAAQQSLIPAGSFTMGRTKTTADDATKMRPQILLDDRPTRTVTLPAFYLDTHEVTHAQYAEFLAQSKRPAPYHWKPELAKSNIAIYNVSWEDARAYCEFRGGRLPTEAEWERAARGGLEGQDYPWGDKFDAKLLRSGTDRGPGEPGKFAANAFGLFDMAGNMAEWTNDWFDRETYKNGAAPNEGLYKVIRGGAWSDQPRRVTVFFRNWVRPSQRQPNIGFRCARSVDPAAEIERLIAGFAGTVSYFAKNLTTGRTVGRRSLERVRTASTIKLPILIAVAQAVHDGKASWEELITLDKDEIVSGSGVIREFTPGQKFPLRDIANLMIVVSDNTCTNLLIERFTADYVNEVMDRYGFPNTKSMRKIMGDGKNLKPNPGGWSKFSQIGDHKKYGIGVSTPAEMVGILEALEQGRLVSPEDSKHILEILRRQQYTDGIGRHETHPVASKSGSLDALRSDVGIVYGKSARVAIAITVDGMPKTDYSPDNVGNVLISQLTALLLEQLGPIDSLQ